MSGLSQKTLDELAAGAAALAAQSARTTLSPERLKELVSVQERAACLRDWERKGWLTVYKPPIRMLSDTGVREIDPTVYKVRSSTGSDTLVEFDDRVAEANGTSPSELLLANIALALVGAGRL